MLAPVIAAARLLDTDIARSVDLDMQVDRFPVEADITRAVDFDMEGLRAALADHDVAAVATDEPDVAENIVAVATLACTSPPGSQETQRSSAV